MNTGQKIKRNLLVGIGGQIVALVLGILLPRLIITSYGSEINGLLSSVTNIYAYIALVEAGVAAASSQALYKPIAENNREQINAVLSATNQYYKKSGFVYLVLVFLFSLGYPLIIESEIPFATIFMVIFFNGIGNVINYFFHGKYLILLKADGKQYVRTGLNLLTNTLKQIIKIAFIKFGYNVVFVQFAAMLASFAQMIYITYYINRYYGWVDIHVKPDRQSISQSKNVVVHEINYMITSNVDTILLTAFKTLKIVSVYSLYNLLFGTVDRLLRVVRDSVEFKIAHLYHTNKAKFQEVFYAFEVYYITLVFSVFSVVNYFVLPFISIYTKDVSDIEYVIPLISFLFVFIALLSAGRYPSDAMVHIAGHFKQTQNSAIIETVINIISSIILVQIAGIEGVLLGTIISSLYRTNYLIHYVNKNIIFRSSKATYICWGLNLMIFVISLAVNQAICVNLDSYASIFLFCIPYGLCSIILYFGIISLVMIRNVRIIWHILKLWYSRLKIKRQ